MCKSKSNKSIRIAKDDVDNSDSDDQREPMSKAHSPSTRERRRELLIVQNNLTFYGLYNAEFIDDMRASFDEDQTFSPGQKESLAKTPNDASLRKHILEPPCFEEFKIPRSKALLPPAKPRSNARSTIKPFNSVQFSFPSPQPRCSSTQTRQIPLLKSFYIFLIRFERISKKRI